MRTGLFSLGRFNMFKIEKLNISISMSMSINMSISINTQSIRTVQSLIKACRRTSFSACNCFPSSRVTRLRISMFILDSFSFSSKGNQTQ
jgi:hypothetical protein